MSDRFVDLLRHGEVQGGACFRGGRDDPLTGAGWEQMTRSLETANRNWSAVLSSPARRCAAFARMIADRQSLPLRILDDFAERHYGDWEGRAADRIPAAELIRFWSDPAGYTPPGAEPFAEFRQRVLTAWHQIASGSGGTETLILTHGGVVRVIVASVLDTPDTALLLLEVPPACRTRIRLPPAPGQASLVFHGAPCFHGI